MNPPAWRDPFVLVVAGQSNAANHGRPRGRAGAGSYAVSASGVFRLEDPLPGSTSAWADLPGPTGRPCSAVADWIPVGVHARRLPEVLKALRSQQLAVDAVVWHQGETEAWIASVRALGIDAPIYECLTSRDGQGVINPGIRQAQASVWNSQERVFAGPDTDSLGDSLRSDRVHFNARGLEAFAVLLQHVMDQPSSQRAIRLDDLPQSARP